MNLDWAQKYRPTTLQDVILPLNLSKRLETIVAQKGGISLLFWGRPGCGKTTVGQLINPENTYRIDCSTSRSIEMVRSLDRICSTCSLEGGRRLILLDEADHLSKEAQNAFRGVIEKFSSNNDFIMTANSPNILSEPIRSRCLPVHFDINSDPDLKTRFKKRIVEILNLESKFVFDLKVIDKILEKTFPDLRRTLKNVQFSLG